MILPSPFTWIDLAVSIAGWVVFVVDHADNSWAPTPYSQASMLLIATIYVYPIVSLFSGLSGRNTPERNEGGFDGGHYLHSLVGNSLAFCWRPY
ncbi:hypothetical protein N7468_000563 [Penicillium chermesinum]|uniref:Uncharacterized protein n=1 Tax=Penicillium chermesinum TaxID=63820 RepID=A0A9W9TYI5_9EURO|nr:uncharacterized protein N7468_000563 [Penicillium chermesinum]KAJ5249112.1 hypothetical protein N7468_000563 [Penicillium chermesinum]